MIVPISVRKFVLPSGAQMAASGDLCGLAELSEDKKLALKNLGGWKSCERCLTIRTHAHKKELLTVGLGEGKG